jgi:PIN domain nuclease of toxin-antitoxin system
VTYLVDTQVALWILLKDRRLSEKVFFERFSAEETFIFHQVSTLEIQIKYDLNKLRLPYRPETFLKKAVDATGFVYENIADDGIFFLSKLPQIHRDPFDRLLIAHAIAFGWTIITADEKFERYPVRIEPV